MVAANVDQLHDATFHVGGGAGKDGAACCRGGGVGGGGHFVGVLGPPFGEGLDGFHVLFAEDVDGELAAGGNEAVGVGFLLQTDGDQPGVKEACMTQLATMALTSSPLREVML